MLTKCAYIVFPFQLCESMYFVTKKATWKVKKNKRKSASCKGSGYKDGVDRGYFFINSNWNNKLEKIYSAWSIQWK